MVNARMSGSTRTPSIYTSGAIERYGFATPRMVICEPVPAVPELGMTTTPAACAVSSSENVVTGATRDKDSASTLVSEAPSVVASWSPVSNATLPIARGVAGAISTSRVVLSPADTTTETVRET